MADCNVTRRSLLPPTTRLTSSLPLPGHSPAAVPPMVHRHIANRGAAHIVGYLRVATNPIGRLPVR
ncbi:hypothetical protein BV20DRAFT_964086 [Pilatotrama ljubarskyi]|nr:hypothetical protein BV20DRAFT_967457 [Pilatotrama ljubarskyi]KAI0372493.1 hypothetical protein BV20DRAFT_964086 [Pilatotrama ljubarskyi]